MSRLAILSAQDAASTPAGSADVETLREQVQSLTEIVKALKKQVKDQQTALEKANLAGEQAPPQNAAASISPTPAAAAPPRFPTEDTSVVGSTNAPRASTRPGVNANGTSLPGNFPTTDTSVVTSTTSAPGGLTSPITFGGGENYMNISFDGLFALAYSSPRDLDPVEVGAPHPPPAGVYPPHHHLP